MPFGQTSARDVQLLLWAVGEAHARERQDDDRLRVHEEGAPLGDPDFFTEWQPAGR